MIRKFKREDIDFIMDIWLKCNIQSHSFLNKSYWKENFNMVKDMIPSSNLYIYETDGEIAGFAGIIEGYIAGIFVKENMQSKGIGKKLIKECSKDYKTLSLNVYEKNQRAVKFYLNQGFIIDKKQCDDATGEYEYLMVLRK